MLLRQLPTERGSHVERESPTERVGPDLARAGNGEEKRGPAVARSRCATLALVVPAAAIPPQSRRFRARGCQVEWVYPAWLGCRRGAAGGGFVREFLPVSERFRPSTSEARA